MPNCLSSKNVDNGFKKNKRKYNISQIEKADKAIGEIWAEFVEMNSAAIKHFDPNIREAVERFEELLCLKRQERSEILRRGKINKTILTKEKKYHEQNQP